MPAIKLPEAFLILVRSVTDKRPKAVIDHIIENGSVTTEKLRNNTATTTRDVPLATFARTGFR